MKSLLSYIYNWFIGATVPNLVKSVEVSTQQGEVTIKLDITLNINLKQDGNVSVGAKEEDVVIKDVVMIPTFDSTGILESFGKENGDG